MLKELYKYRAFNDFSLKNISEGVIWVSNQKDLNDPFEYYFHIEPDMTFEEVVKRKRDATKNNYMKKQEELIHRINKMFSTGGIFSLSEEIKGVRHNPVRHKDCEVIYRRKLHKNFYILPILNLRAVHTPA